MSTANLLYHGDNLRVLRGKIADESLNQIFSMKNTGMTDAQVKAACG